MCRLQEKASKLFTQHRGATDMPDLKISIFNSLDPHADELAIFSGQTCGLLGRSKSSIPTSETSVHDTWSSDLPVAPDRLNRAQTEILGSQTMSQNDIHPSLMEYISSLPLDVATSLVPFGGEPDVISEFSQQYIERDSLGTMPVIVDSALSGLSLGLQPSAYRHPDQEAAPSSSVNHLSSFTFLNLLQQLNSETSETDVLGLGDGCQEGLDIAGGAGDDWVTFMKESGLA